MKKLLLVVAFLATGSAFADKLTTSGDTQVYLSEIRNAPHLKFSRWGGSGAKLINDLRVTEHRNKLSSSGEIALLLLELLLDLTSDAAVLPEEQAPQLHAMIEKHAKALGVAKPLILVGRSKDVFNAMATSLSPCAGVIFLFEHLVGDMTDAELEGVVGHELAHIKHNDVSLRLKTAGALVAAYCAGVVLQNSESDIVKVAGATTTLSSAILFFFGMPKLSCWQEKRADISGAYNKQQAQNLIGAIHKIQEKHEIKDGAWNEAIKAIKESNNLTGLQYFGYRTYAEFRKFLATNPATKALDYLGSYMSSHPDTPDRIAYLIEHEKTLAA